MTSLWFVCLNAFITEKAMKMSLACIVIFIQLFEGKRDILLTTYKNYIN